MNEGKQSRPRIDIAESDAPDPEIREEDEASRWSLGDDEDMQREILGKLKSRNQQGKRDRMAEVQNARDARLSVKGIQQFYWDENLQDVVFESDEDSPYDSTFNITQGYQKIFCALFMGARAKVRPEADDPFDGRSVRNTGRAKLFERAYRKWNDPAIQQMKVSRFLWTDSRVVTRTVSKDGKQTTQFWGTLESRLPIAAPEDDDIPLKNCALIELENEFPLVQMKRDYPDVRKKLNSGNGDSYERNARLAVKRNAGSDTSVDVSTGEDSYGMGTKTWSYMRPEFFEEFQESTRVQLEENYPSGLLVVHSGDVYLESEECDPDSCLDVIFPLPADGMSRSSIGQALMQLQDSCNTGQNLIEETFDHGIPTTYWDEKTNIDGLNKNRDMPGQSRKMVRTQGSSAGDHFYQTQAVNPPQQLMAYVENLRGPMAQFVTGLPPAAFGAEMEDQKTASGYAQARTQALGGLGLVWKPYTAWRSREMTRAVKSASEQSDDIKATLPAERRGGREESVKIAPADLKGLSFTNASDENFPEDVERAVKQVHAAPADGAGGIRLGTPEGTRQLVSGERASGP